jgi:itaconyl-CoA hydratase
VGGRAIQTLEYSDVRHSLPVFHGDTIYAETTVVQKSELPDGTGAVKLQHRAINQRGETVLNMQRTIVIRRHS